MNVEFKWCGSENSQEGVATYSISSSPHKPEYILPMPSFLKAQQFLAVLENVYKEGYIAGVKDVKYAVSQTLTKLTQ